MPELAVAGRGSVDGFLTRDGLILLFNAQAAENQGDLYLARRSSTTAPFEAPIHLLELNTSWDERDPWLSSDEKWLFFSSDRLGRLCIYQVPVQLRR
jgi:Tol biopolymer transport system component